MDKALQRNKENEMRAISMNAYMYDIKETNHILSKNKEKLARKLTATDILALVICRRKENEILNEIVKR